MSCSFRFNLKLVEGRRTLRCGNDGNAEEKETIDSEESQEIHLPLSFYNGKVPL